MIDQLLCYICCMTRETTLNVVMRVIVLYHMSREKEDTTGGTYGTCR